MQTNEPWTWELDYISWMEQWTIYQVLTDEVLYALKDNNGRMLSQALYE
jgi:hypothetical protein